MHADIRPAGIQPLLQCPPDAQQRLVRKLNHWFAACGVHIKRDQPVPGEFLKDRLHIASELEQLRQADTPPRIPHAIAQRHQPQEDLPSGVSPLRAQSVVDFLGAPGERSENTAACLVRGQGKRLATAFVEDLGERELQQGQRPQLILYVVNHRGNQLRIHFQANLARRSHDRAFQLVGRQWQHKFGALAHQLAEFRVVKRAIGKIRP